MRCRVESQVSFGALLLVSWEAGYCLHLTHELLWEAIKFSCGNWSFVLEPILDFVNLLYEFRRARRWQEAPPGLEGCCRVLAIVFLHFLGGITVGGVTANMAWSPRETSHISQETRSTLLVDMQ